MALNAFLTLQGKKQGPIKGSVTQKGREGTIMVIAAQHEVLMPVSNAGSGAAVGKRIHKPFVITKELDKSSPLLYQALVNHEELTVWELKFYTAAVTAAGGAGQEKQHYTVKLTNAFITDIRFFLPNTREPDTAKFSSYEEIEFKYQGIEWIWTEGAITATDQWDAPV